MKQIVRWIVLALTTLMLIASLDAIPDPPAIYQHSSEISALHGGRTPAALNERSVDVMWPTILNSQPDLRCTSAVTLSEPALPQFTNIRTHHFADSSPPSSLY